MRPLMSEWKARQSEMTERCISDEFARLAGSMSPAMDYAAGMVDLGYVLGAYPKERRDALLEQLRRIVNERRKELQRQRIDRIMERQS